jgi:hypothetical protein
LRDFLLNYFGLFQRISPEALTRDDPLRGSKKFRLQALLDPSHLGESQPIKFVQFSRSEYGLE